ncbi:MAG: hypothetical protein ACE5L7_10360 [Candidatus Aminicenantales bacterium]
MRAKWIVFVGGFLILFSMVGFLSAGEEPPKAQVKAGDQVSQLTKAMTQRLSKGLHVKNIVGDPVKVGKVTVIPIIMIDIGFGGGGGGPSGGPPMGGSGFFMSGEARPLGFVIISKAGVQFVSVGKVPRK